MLKVRTKSSFLYDKYVKSSIMVDSFYWNSIGSLIPTHKNLLLACFLIRPILDLKFPLIVGKLALEMHDHTHPYTFGWKNGEVESKLTK